MSRYYLRRSITATSLRSQLINLILAKSQTFTQNLLLDIISWRNWSCIDRIKMLRILLELGRNWDALRFGNWSKLVGLLRAQLIRSLIYFFVRRKCARFLEIALHLLELALDILQFLANRVEIHLQTVQDFAALLLLLTVHLLVEIRSGFRLLTLHRKIIMTHEIVLGLRLLWRTARLPVLLLYLRGQVL